MTNTTSVKGSRSTSKEMNHVDSIYSLYDEIKMAIYLCGLSLHKL